MLFDNVQIPRQHMIRGAGLMLTAGALAACGDGNKPATDSETPAPEASPTAAATTEASPSAAAQAGAIAKTSDVPVGSGLIVGDVVVTQPSAGDFKAFSAICTHKGCTVDAVANGTIDCPCHGSKFHLDGTVANGPAAKPLEPKSISVEGDEIILS